MSPQQVARLALQWHRANKADPIAVIRHTAESYRFTDSQIAETIGHLAAIAPELVPAPERAAWLHNPAN